LKNKLTGIFRTKNFRIDGLREFRVGRFEDRKFDNAAIASHNPTMLGLALGVAAAGAISAGYQSMAPTGRWFGRAFSGTRPPSRQIALTFDDGPNDPHTLHLLDTLSRHDVRATFFMIGRYVKQRGDLAAEVARRKHIIGNHTFTHPFLTLQSARQIRDELSQCQAALTESVGMHSNLFRPPWGARRPAVFRIARELGLTPVMWNVTGFDWDAPSSEYIESKVSRRIRGGDVVLLHDGGHREFGADRSRTIQAVDRLIARYKSDGFEFVTLPQLMGAAIHAQSPGARVSS
jgi:peptidoglycan/xylan/chitin deacetylase (PgdA/CDA1 family)